MPVPPEILAKVIAPLLTGYLYESNIELPYITTGGIALIGVVICYIWIKNQKEQMMEEDVYMEVIHSN